MEFDKDLSARQEARLLAKQAEEAQKTLGQMSQQQLDAIVAAVAAAFEAKAEELAEMAVRETGFGNVGDKTVKNRFASRHVLESYCASASRAVRGSAAKYPRGYRL